MDDNSEATQRPSVAAAAKAKTALRGYGYQQLQ
jgi:hypothetical protein